jgi:hypothetical protein
VERRIAPSRHVDPDHFAGDFLEEGAESIALGQDIRRKRADVRGRVGHFVEARIANGMDVIRDLRSGAPSQRRKMPPTSSALRSTSPRNSQRLRLDCTTLAPKLSPIAERCQRFAGREKGPRPIDRRSIPVRVPSETILDVRRVAIEQHVHAKSVIAVRDKPRRRYDQAKSIESAQGRRGALGCSSRFEESS